MAEPFAGIQVGNELIIADAVLGEQYIHASQASVYPVEGGEFNTDGILQFPDIFVMEMVITDDPIPLGKPSKVAAQKEDQRGIAFTETVNSFPRPAPRLNNVSNLVSAGFERLTQGGTVELTTTGPADPQARTKRIYERLVQVYRERKIVTVGMTLGQYANCVITRIDIRRDRPEASILAVVEFQRVRFAEVQFVQARRVDRPSAQDAATRSAATTEASAEKAAALQSAASSFAGLLGG